MRQARLVKVTPIPAGEGYAKPHWSKLLQATLVKNAASHTGVSCVKPHWSKLRQFPLVKVTSSHTGKSYTGEACAKEVTPQVKVSMPIKVAPDCIGESFAKPDW